VYGCVGVIFFGDVENVVVFGGFVLLWDFHGDGIGHV
jgi:hypothetical protein